MNKIIEECKKQRWCATTSGLGTSHKWVLGSCWSRKAASRKLRSLRIGPRIFSEVAELTRRSAVTTTQRLKSKMGFTPFCKGLRIYCNGFWGYGALGPHKCNQKWPKLLYKRSRNSRGKDINTLYHRCMLSLLSYISYRQVYWSRERKNALAILCTQILKRREEKRRKRETAKKCIIGTL